MPEDLLTKAKESQSPEELLTLLHENGMEEFTKEDAEELYTQLHTTGELTDEEMENVSGGTSVKVDGKKHKVVTNHTKCFTGKWEHGFYTPREKGEPERTVASVWCKREDHKSLRRTWGNLVIGGGMVCGTCYHLGFTKTLTGYCEVEDT